MATHKFLIRITFIFILFYNLSEYSGMVIKGKIIYNLSNSYKLVHHYSVCFFLRKTRSTIRKLFSFMD